MVGSSIGMPDIHSGYGFAVGNVAAFDMDDPASVVSPGGVGFDINCGVRLIRTGIVSATVVLDGSLCRPLEHVRGLLCQALFIKLPSQHL